MSADVGIMKMLMPFVELIAPEMMYVALMSKKNLSKIPHKLFLCVVRRKAIISIWRFFGKCQQLGVLGDGAAGS